MPHTTTDHGATGPLGGPWLVSMAMWFNCMQFIGEEPMPVAELLRRARTGTNLDGMRRWGYVFLESASGDARRRPPPRDLTIRATRKGHRAQEVWRPLPAVIEDRWRERFGAAGIGGLRASLWALAAQAEAEVPDCLPILGPGLFSGRKQTYPRRTPEAGPDPWPGRPAAARTDGPGAARLRHPLRAALPAVPGHLRERTADPGLPRRAGPRPAGPQRGVEGIDRDGHGHPDQARPGDGRHRSGGRALEGGPADPARPDRSVGLHGRDRHPRAEVGRAVRRGCHRPAAGGPGRLSRATRTILRRHR